MKLKILVAIETVALIFFVSYGYIKSAEADMQKTRAEELAAHTNKLNEDAQREAVNAERQAAAAIMAETKVEELQAKLETCRENK